ncbi:conserved hypothetical protein [sediment metagenome]|uniref:Uncharacterized protein n=1 Tax=sediment metagenome TaxID=749907 RepID=D9PJF1_9ZZZZ
MPSLGFSIAAAWLLTIEIPSVMGTAKGRIISISILGIIAILFSVKTISRNLDWENNFTLFTHDVEISANSAKANAAAGAQWLEKAIEMKNETQRRILAGRSITYLRKALQIYPKYRVASRDIGTAHFFAGSPIDSVIFYYDKTISLERMELLVYKNITKFIYIEPDIDRRISILEHYNSIYGGVYELNYKLGNLYGRKKGDFQKAAYYFEIAVRLRPKSVEALANLGIAYLGMGQKEKARQAWQKALSIKPEDMQIQENLRKLESEVQQEKEAGTL